MWQGFRFNRWSETSTGSTTPPAKGSSALKVLPQLATGARFLSFHVLNVVILLAHHPWRGSRTGRRMTQDCQCERSAETLKELKRPLVKTQSCDRMWHLSIDWDPKCNITLGVDDSEYFDPVRKAPS